MFCKEETGYAVIEVATSTDLVTAVGSLCDICAGEEVVLHGFFKVHSNFGEQFRVEAYEVHMPETVSAMRKYLASGALPHIGPALARKITETFRDETLEVIAMHPERLAEIKGLSKIKALAIQNEFKRIFGVREAMQYMSSLGLSASVAVAMHRQYGEDAVAVVSANPYTLCGFPAYVDFAQVDRIASDMSFEFDARERVQAGILHVLRHNLNNGHTCLPQKALLDTVSAFLSIEPERIDAEADLLLEKEEICLVECNEKIYVYLPDLLRAEQTIALHMQFLLSLPAINAKDIDTVIRRLELTQQIQYAPLQRQAIMQALGNRVLVLTGGPGTGKTTTVNGMLSAFEQNADRVALAAPTGRAAKRLSELTGRKATTIHRLLEVDYTDDNTVRFLHHEKNLLKCDVIVIDEMSMVDTMLFESLVRALKPACRIIMVGDEDQLPSVGAGNLLGSMMASGVVPTVRLTEIFRQAAESGIVSNAHRIVAGEPLETKGREDDFFILERDDPNVCARLVCELASQRLPASYGYDPIEDIQVLCPSKIGPLGTAVLNPMLQEWINPQSKEKPQLVMRDKIFRLGDKVMQIRNNYDIPFTRPDGGADGAGAFNGDMGRIEAIDVAAQTVTVRSEDRRIVYGAENLRELETAYAVTIHKSQGSEFPAIIMPVLEIPPRLRYRNLLYTGVTRARKLCVLTGHASEAMQMIHNVKRNKRFSCLSSFLAECVQA